MRVDICVYGTWEWVEDEYDGYGMRFPKGFKRSNIKRNEISDQELYVNGWVVYKGGKEYDSCPWLGEG